MNVNTQGQQYSLGRFVISDRDLALDNDARRRHLYVIGQTGTGKSVLLHNLMMADFAAGRGFAFLDPHGTGAEAIADATPTSRKGDVLYFNPLDKTHAVAFNPLGQSTRLGNATVADTIASLLKYIWIDSWGVRLNYILTNALRLLLDTNGTTLAHIPRVLIDDHYRNRLLRKCQDKSIEIYWRYEFMGYTPSYRAEAIGAIQNKVGQFANNPILRHIFGQGSGGLDMSDIIENNKVFIADLSKSMGHETSRIIGSLLTTALFQASEKRRNILEHDRRDFTLYLDEFQNYTTDTIGTILSEARKWRLNLVLAHQFLGQLPPELQQAVIGNAGTRVVFRVGSYDAPLLAKVLDLPQASTLTNLANFNARVSYLQDGAPSDPDLIGTYPPVASESGNLPAVIARTRARYARTRAEVDVKLQAIFRPIVRAERKPRARKRTET